MRKIFLGLFLALLAIAPALAQQSITVKNATVTSLGGGGTKCVNTDNNGKLGAAAADCGSGGGGSGALVLVEQHTASASAALNFTTCFSSTYDTYFIDIVSLVPATQQDIQMLFSINSGSSYDTGSDYNWALVGAAFTSGSLTFGGSGTVGDTKFVMAGGASEFSSQGYFSNSQNVGIHTTWVFNGTYISSGNSIANTAYGLYLSTGSPINGIRFKAASGNLTSGTIRCYGVAKS